MSDMVISGIPAIAIIVGVVEYFKSLGLPTRYAPLLAMSLGIVTGLVVEAVNTYPTISPWVTAVVSGLAVGMSATGLYKIGSRWLS